MKKLFLLAAFCFYFSVVTFAQWQPCNGPYGGNISGMIMNGPNIFAVTVQQGIFISSDNGNSWSPRNNGITNYSASCITLKGNRLFFGTSSGLFSSDDNGTTWNAVFLNGLANFAVRALGTNSQSVFMLSDNVVYRSNDNGASWTPLIGNQYIASLGINGNTVFIGTTDHTLYRSVDNGDTFTYIDLSSLGDIYYLSSFTFTGSNIFAIGANGCVYKSSDNGDSWVVCVYSTSDPAAISLTSDGSKVYVGCYYGQLTWPYSTGTGGIYVTADDGAHWSSLGMTGYSVEKILFTGARIIAGTYIGGVFISDNNGLTWSSSNTGLVMLPVLAMIQNGSELFISTWDRSPSGYDFTTKVLKSSDHGQTWIHSDSGLSNYPVNVFAIGSSFMVAGSSQVYISRNNGYTWQSIFNPGYTFNAFAISGSFIFAGTNAGIFLSGDEGSTWHSANNGLGNTTVLSLMVRGGSIFAGTASGIFRSTDYGQSWSSASNGIEGYSISSMTSNNSYLFASGYWYYGAIFRSADNGDHWFNIGIDFPTFSTVNCLIASDDKIFAGTTDITTQILYSSDNGDNWSVARSGLPVGFSIPVMTILDSLLFVAPDFDYPYSSSGSGVWKRPLSDFVPFGLSGDTLVMKETAGDIKTLGITSETPWNIEALVPAWLTVDKISGFSSDLLTFTTMEDNPNQQPRYTSMEVISMGVSRHVTIVQKPKLIGIDDPQVPAVSIYPNPTSGSVLIETTPGFDKITLYNVPGQILSELPVVSSKTRMDLSQYGKGIYYIRLTGRKGTRIQQLVVL